MPRGHGEQGLVLVSTIYGNVLRRPSVPVTEEDEVRVLIPVDEDLAPSISVRRTSAARRVDEVRILGAGGVSVSQKTVDALESVRDERCQFEATLGDFAPGLGEVEIRLTSLQGTNLQQITVGSFDFNVLPVYTWMFSAGPILTELRDPSFRVATNAAGEGFIVEEDAEERILWVLSYTVFPWEKRTPEDGWDWDPWEALKRFYPTFGIVLNAPTDNALLGLAYKLPAGFALQGGWHWGHVVEGLAPNSGLTVGGPFEGEGDPPVARDWDSKMYYGITVDLRVVGQLLGLIDDPRFGGIR